MASYAGARGIRNVSGVSCHISSTLQVIYHGLPELRQALMQLADASGGCGRDEDDGCDGTSKAPQFVHELGLLFKDLSLEGSDSNAAADESAATPAVNPMPLYEVLPPALNYRDIGDAATALRAILTTIRSGLEELRTPQMTTDQAILMKANDALDACLCGSTAQRIEGAMRTIEEDASGNKILKLVKRRKPDKERKLTIPFPIPVRGYSCLHDALASVTTEAQAINGYDWEAVEKYEQSETILETVDGDDENEEEDSVSSDSSSDSSDSSSSDSSSDTSSSESYSSSSSEEDFGDWKTSKYSLLSKVPQYLFIHLKRFEYKGGRVQKLSSVLDVPKKLDIASYSADSSGGDGAYELCAGIVHIDEPIEGANDFDEDAGHYISYVHLSQERKGAPVTDSIDTQMAKVKIANPIQWVEVNDEKITLFDGETGESHVLNVLSGRYSKKGKAGGRKTGSKYATLLLYRRAKP